LKQDVTKKLADFIYELEFERLPQDTICKAKEVILDYIGSLLAGYNAGNLLSQKLINLVKYNGGIEEATIIGTAIKVPVTNAALCNGVLSHVVELDDGHRIARGHPGVTVISSALATAEYLHLTGEELLTAIVAGYDIFVRIASSINPSHLERGFHTTGTCGALAAATAAAKLFRLNPPEIANALGLAGIQAAGLLEVTIDGQMAKPLHSGKSAQAGVLSVILAKDGVRGPKTIIEGKKGFVKAMSNECNFHLMLKDLNKKFHINDCYVKLYPSCRHTHAPVDAAIELLRENDFKYTSISSILIKTYPTAISFAGEIFKPEAPEEAKFSIPYCVCAALVKGKLGLKELEPDCLYSPSIRALTERVKLEPDPSLESTLPKTKGAEVRITLYDGRKLLKRINLPKGEVENPVSRDELISKFIYCTDSHLNDGKRDKIINKVFSIEQINNISDFVSL
jgi:2-methylcitrate dehydratase PrpD